MSCKIRQFVLIERIQYRTRYQSSQIAPDPLKWLQSVDKMVIPTLQDTQFSRLVPRDRNYALWTGVNVVHGMLGTT